MSASYENVLRGFLGREQGLAEAKQAQLEKASELKKKLLDPDYETFNPDQYEVLDSDTAINRYTNEVHRFQGRQGESLDAFETPPIVDPVTGEIKKKDVYAENPSRFEFHRRAYAKLFGKDPEDVSKEELYEFGELQKQRTIANMEKLRGKTMRRNGIDVFNRTLTQFDDDGGAFEHMQGQEGNAAYFAPSNYNRIGKDLVEGKLSDLHRGSGDRSNIRAFTGDAAVKALSGTAEMANSLAQSLSVLGGVNTDGVDEFFSNNRDRIQGFKEALGSDEMLYQDRMAQKRNSLDPELFELRKKKAIESGMPEWRASLSAGVDDFADGVEDLYENPGRIVDGFFESVPYMLGVGAVGRFAVNKAVKNIHGEILDKITKTSAARGVSESSEMLARKAAKNLEKFKASTAGKEILGRTAANTGMTTVGLTEGLTTSADVYDSITSMTEAEAAQSKEYQALRESGKSHEDALESLGREASWKTFLATTLVAGTAGRLTGAAAWESKLLTRLADIRKGAPTVVAKAAGEVAGQAAEKKAQGAFKTAAKAVGRGVWDATAGAGRKEAIEEAIQSGGGTLISQIASQEATGKPIGPGVGGAAAEGAVIGFASGAGMSLPSAVLKPAIGAVYDAFKGKDKYSKFVDPAKIKVVPAATPSSGGGATTAAASNVPGGTVTKNYQMQESKDYDPQKEFDSTLMGMVEKAKQGDIDLTQYNILKNHYSNIKNPKPEDQQVMDTATSSFKRKLTAETQRISEAYKADPNSLTDDDKAMLRAASEQGIEGANSKNFSGTTGKALKSAEKVEELLGAIDADAEKSKATVAKAMGTSIKSVEEVIRTKLGDVASTYGLGLRAHKRTLTELMNTNSQEKFEKGANEFRKFILSQDAKIKALRALIADPDHKVTNKWKYEYVAGATEGLLNTLEKEQVGMLQVRDELVSQWKAWNPGVKLSSATTAKTPIAATTKTATPAPAPSFNQGEASQGEGVPKTLQWTPDAEQGQPDSGTASQENNAPQQRTGASKTKHNPDVTALRNQASEAKQKGNFAESVKLLNKAIDIAQKTGDTRLGELKKHRANMAAKATAETNKKSAADKAERIAKSKADKTESKPEEKAPETTSAPAPETAPVAESEPELRKLTGKKQYEATVRDGREKVTVKVAGEFEFFGHQFIIHRPSNGAKNEWIVSHKETGLFISLGAKAKSLSQAYEDVLGIIRRAGKERLDSAAAEALKKQEGALGAGLFDEDSDTQAVDPQVSTQMREYQSIVDDADRQLDQLNKSPDNGGIVPEEVFFGNTNLQAQYEKGFAKYKESMPDKDAAIATLSAIRNFYADKIDNRIDTAVVVDTAVEDSLFEALNTLLNDRTTTIPASDIPDFSLPFNEDDAQPDGKVLPGTFAKMAKLGLPKKFTDAFKRASKKIRSVLGAVPDIATALRNPTIRNNLATRLGLKPREKSALDKFVKFHDAFVTTLNEILGDITQVGVKTRQGSKLYLADNLRDSPLNYLMQDGKLHPDVATAVAVQGLNWLGTQAARAMLNDRSAINAILGRDDNHPITPDEWQKLNQGTLLTGAVDTMGKAIMDQLNIQQIDPKNTTEGIDNILYYRLANSLGVLAISTLRASGYLNVTSVENSWFQKQAGNENADPKDRAKVLLVYPQSVSEDDWLTANAINQEAQEIWENGSSLFQPMFGTTTMAKEPSLSEPTERDIPEKVKNSLSDVPPDLKQAIGYSQKLKIKSEGNVVRLLKRMDAVKFLTAGFGYKPNMDVVHEDDRKEVEAANAGLMRDLKQGIKWSDKIGNLSFYFTYYVTGSGRTHIDSNTVNLQANKVHRFMFSMRRWERTYKTDPVPGTDGYRRFEDFLISVGLGLDIDAGKLTREQILDNTRAYLSETNEDGTESNIKLALDILQQNSDEQFTEAEWAILAPFLENGTHSVAALSAYNTYRKARDEGDAAFEVSLPMFIDGITNGVSAGALQTPPSQEGSYEQNKNMLRATAVFFEGDLQNFPDWKQVEGHQDNYQSTAGGTGNRLENMATGSYTPAPDRNQDSESKTAFQKKLEKRDEVLRRSAREVFSSGVLPNILELAASIGRAWAKDPLMIVAYSASVYSVIGKVIDNAFIQFRTNLAAANAPDASGNPPTDADRMETIRKVLNQVGQVMAATEQANREAAVSVQTQGWTNFIKMTDEKQIAFIENVAKKDYEGSLFKMAREFKLNDDSVSLFTDGIRATYGEALEDTLHEQLRPIEEIRKLLNEANAFMNIAFVEDFTRRVAQLEKIRGVVLNPSDINGLLKQMFDEGMVPSVATPLSTKLSENLETTKYGSQVIGGNAAGVVFFSDLLEIVTRAYEGIEGKPTAAKRQESLRAAITRKIPITDVGVAAVVKLIHSSDGAVNASIWGKYPALNVHDSVGVAADDIDSIGTELNGNFFSIHRAWSLAVEIGKSLDRMRLLLDENDFRLTTEQKQNVHRKYMEHLVKRKVIKAVPSNPEQGTESRYRRIKNQIGAVRQAREKLFAEIVAINQFAKQGTTFVVSSMAKRLQEMSDAEFSKAYEEAYKEDIRRAAENNLKGRINTLVLNSELGATQFKNALIDYMDSEHPDAHQMLYVLSAVLNRTGHPAGPTVSLMYNLFQDYLKATPTRVAVPITIVPAGSINGGKWAGVFSPTHRTIEIDREKGTVASIILHEILHAAIESNLQEMEARNDPKLNEIFVNLKRFTTALENTGNPADTYYAAAITAPTSMAQQISEYMAYVFTTPSRKTPTQNKFVIEYLNRSLGADLKDLDFLGTLGDIIADPVTRNVVLRSSTDEISEELFRDSERTKLEADKVRSLFDYVEQLNQGSTDPQHKEMLDTLIERFLIPGLQSIEPVFTMLEINPNTSRNVGDVDSTVHEHIIRVEAAGNQLTNNVDMPLSEVLAHEISHPIMKAGINGNHRIRQEAIRLYEQVRDSGRITVMSFMQEDWTGDRADALAAATERYNHIFHNKNGDNLHEFMAIALTNKQFAIALSTVGDRDTRKPIWEDGILKGIRNLFDRTIAWITGNLRRADKGNSIHTSVVELASEILAFNQRNMARVNNQDPNQYRINRIDNAIRGFADEQLDRLQKKLRRTPEEIEAGPGSGIKEVARATVHSALVARTDEGQRAIRGYIKQAGISQNSLINEVLSEVLPYNQDNLGTNENKPGWIDLLRKSKLLIDTASERMFKHVRDDVMNAFDKKRYLKTQQREALSNVIMKTDLSSLMENATVPDSITIGDLQDFVSNPSRVSQYLAETQLELKNELALHQRGAKLYEMFNNQTSSLGNYMVKGEMLIEHGMQNAHNIVKQFNLDERHRTKFKNEERIIQLVDRMATLKALQLTSEHDLDIVKDIIDHEMSREVVENGFYTLVGMHSNFKKMSLEIGFDNNPTQMIKGYIHEMVDEDINLESILDTPEERRRMKDLGMVEIGPNIKSPLDDPNAPDTVLFKGVRGLAGYNKSVVSLTNQQARGTNLFSAYGYNSEMARRNIGRIRKDGYALAIKQVNPNWTDKGTHLIPILDDQGNITDYRYVMSEASRKQHLKKKVPFDLVMGRMYSSVTNRSNSKKINLQVVDLLKREYDTFKNSPEHKFVEIGKHAPTQEGRDMWNLLPKDMQINLENTFGGSSFPIRDNAVNLVLGFRKLSFANNEFLGKHAFAVKTAEKVWQEVIQYVRVKTSILNPAVVVANLVSNYVILLSEGIPVSYIKKMTDEAIHGMRVYQQTIRKYDTLNNQIGVARSMGKDVTRMLYELKRIEQDLKNNPVGDLVREGLFTNIVEDLGAHDGSMRESILEKTLDLVPGKVSRGAVKGMKELYMLPGTKTFNAALAATQYGDFIGRYIKFKYDTEQRKVPRIKAIHDALATFIYYDIPQNRWLQAANDYGFAMFTKFFLRIQPVVGRIFSENPTKAFGIIAVQQALMPPPFEENIGNFAFFQGGMRRLEPFPILHLDKIEPFYPSLFKWILGPFQYFGAI